VRKRHHTLTPPSFDTAIQRRSYIYHCSQDEDDLWKICFPEVSVRERALGASLIIP
jgi:hypothetical protein